jgi:8-oxo-dGTP diphosphatase
MKVRPAALIIEAGKILTLRYNYNGTNVYMLPGGNMDFGETMQTCLSRELFEEIGVSTEISDLLFIAEVHQKDMDKLHCIFKCKIAVGSFPKINSEQCSALEIVFLPFDKINIVAMYPNISNEVYQYCISNKPHEVKFVGEIFQPIY